MLQAAPSILSTITWGHIGAFFGIAAILYGIGLYALPALGLGDIANGIIRLALLCSYVLVFLPHRTCASGQLIPRRR